MSRLFLVSRVELLLTYRISDLGNEKATKETFDSEGFVRTGDECKFDLEGNLFVVDRIKELIKVNGNQVAPASLEGLILEHPDVLDCAVIGVPNDSAGEVPKAYVALTASALAKVATGGDKASKEIAASIMKLVADNTIRYKHVREVEFLDAVSLFSFHFTSLAGPDHLFRFVDSQDGFR